MKMSSSVSQIIQNPVIKRTTHLTVVMKEETIHGGQNWFWCQAVNTEHAVKLDILTWKSVGSQPQVATRGTEI